MTIKIIILSTIQRKSQWGIKNNLKNNNTLKNKQKEKKIKIRCNTCTPNPIKD